MFDYFFILMKSSVARYWIKELPKYFQKLPKL